MGIPFRATRTYLLVLSMLLVGVLGTSCSDDVSKQRRYIREVRQIDADVREEVARLTATAPARPADGRQTAAGAKAAEEHSARFDALLDEAVSRHAELEPPSRWEDEHARAVEALRTARAEVEIAEREATAGRTSQAIAAFQRFEKAVLAYQAAIDDMEQDA